MSDVAVGHVRRESRGKIALRMALPIILIYRHGSQLSNEFGLTLNIGLLVNRKRSNRLVLR